MKTILTFVPTIYSMKTTPMEAREYVLKGTSGPVGTKNELKEFFRKGSISVKLIFETLEGKTETEIVKGQEQMFCAQCDKEIKDDEAYEEVEDGEGHILYAHSENNTKVCTQTCYEAYMIDMFGNDEDDDYGLA